MSEKKEKEKSDVPITQKETEKDVFDTWCETFMSIIDEATRIQAQYVQSLTNMQQECVDTTKKLAEAYANISKVVAQNTWGAIKMPTIFTKGISDAIDVTTKITDINNKTILSGLELARQNVKVFNDNIDSFTKLNINFIKTWQSLITPTRS